MDQSAITQDIIRLYDEFTHAPLQRRVFLRRLARMVGGTAAAVSIAAMLDSDQAKAAVVAPDDPRLDIRRVGYQGHTGEVKAYQAMPKGAAKLPAVVCVHENRGLQPHNEDIARRFAVEGFLAFGVDLLSPLGGTPQGDEDAARNAFAKLDRTLALADALAAVAFLKAHPNSTGKVGAVGFCWGGGLVNLIAANTPDLLAGVPYYGDVPVIENAQKVKAKMLLHYAALDDRINRNAEAWIDALKAAGVEVQSHMYEGANHAFNNDTGARYHEPSAKLAWSRTIEFFKKSLA